MIGWTSGIEKSVKCTAAITGQGIIAKPGADDDTFSAGAASTDYLVGVFQHATSAAGEDVRVMLTGVSLVKAGGTITRGNPVTSDGSGQGVAASPGAGVNAHIIGLAMASAVAGDLFPVLLSPGRIQG